MSAEDKRVTVVRHDGIDDGRLVHVHASCASASPGAFEGEDEPLKVKEMKMPVGPTTTHGMLNASRMH